MEARKQRIDSREQDRRQCRAEGVDESDVEVSAEGDFQGKCADSQRGKGDQGKAPGSRGKPELRMQVSGKHHWKHCEQQHAPAQDDSLLPFSKSRWAPRKRVISPKIARACSDPV